MAISNTVIASKQHIAIERQQALFLGEAHGGVYGQFITVLLHQAIAYLPVIVPVCFSAAHGMASNVSTEYPVLLHYGYRQ
jgi:hypothetical protein